MDLETLYRHLPNVDPAKIDQALEWPIAVMRGEPIRPMPSNIFLVERVLIAIKKIDAWSQIEINGARHVAFSDTEGMEELNNQIDKEQLFPFLTLGTTHSANLSEAFIDEWIDPALEDLLEDNVRVKVYGTIWATISLIIEELKSNSDTATLQSFLSLQRDVLICGIDNNRSVVFLTR